MAEESRCFKFCMIAMAIVIMAGFVFSIVWETTRPCDTKYTVTITSVDGLDLHSDRQALSPVFGITVHIDSTHNQMTNECVGGVGSSAIVTYGDALLAKGTMPGLCVQRTKVREAATKAWGMNVEVPHFLRDRLASELERGQAVVDVAVRTPGGGGCYINGCLDTVLVCKAKIGGGPSPCFRATTVSGTNTNT
uniref:Late embryogenesis abundant protein LEA-2 subgroup domain-containing protein n=1 Tax=Hordeum vulgare subsp. vulgare TaxID=112509 RepID=A0A8I6XS76_HORVV